MNDNLVTRLNPLQRFPLSLASMPDLDSGLVRNPVTHRKHSPVFTRAKQRARGNKKHIFAFPCDHLDLNVIGIFQSLSISFKVTNHVHSLLLDSKR